MTAGEPSPPTPEDGHASGLRHPIQAAEDEAAHLRDVANRGESASTPAILAGGVLMVLIPLFLLILTIVLTVAYLATRGASSDTTPATSRGSAAYVTTRVAK